MGFEALAAVGSELLGEEVATTVGADLFGNVLGLDAFGTSLVSQTPLIGEGLGFTGGSMGIDFLGSLGGSSGLPSWLTAGNLLQGGSSLMGFMQGQQMIDASKGADPFGPYRPQFAQQLMALMANPSSVTQLPGYTAAMGSAEQALTRNLASQGLTGSGAAAEALTKFGGTFQNDYFQQMLQTLGGLSGANIAGAGTSLQGMAAGINTQNKSLDNLVKILPTIIGGGN